MLSDNLLVTALDGKVRAIARGFVRKSGSVSEYDDLVQEGWLAVLSALPKYDAAKGASVETFAKNSARWRMQDYLRSLDWRPRGERKKGEELPAFKVDKRPGDYGEGAARVMTEAELSIILSRIPPRDRAMLLSYHIEGLTMEETGRRFGVSQSRASHLVARGMASCS